MPDANGCDALVVGGGLAGSAVATLLGQAGRHVTLLERTRGPHDKVCGEFLSVEALRYLDLLGVDVRRLGALTVSTLRLTRGARTTEQLLPFPAMSLTRRVLDEALLTRAAQAGVTVRRGVSVDSLVRQQDSLWRATTADGDCFNAAAAFLATGKHDLRGHCRPMKSSLTRHAGLLAFNAYFRVPSTQAQLLQEAIEVYLFRHGYCGLQLVEDGTANLGLLIERKHFTTWPELLQDICRQVPLLSERLGAAVQTLVKPLALSHIPYGFRRPNTVEDLWVVGDQAAVIPSFSGDGMAIALHSGVQAARLFLAGGSAQQYQAKLFHQLSLPVSLATVVSRVLVGAPALAAMVRRVPGVVAQVASNTRIPLVD